MSVEWEYLFLTTGVAGGILRPHTQDGRELDNWRKSPPVYEYVHELGAQGWEMVNHSFPSCGSYPSMVFKRPKEG
jgi:hypothetical protein